jgi:N-acetylglutamate synthase-like GNAT family acetyltransferase
MLNVGSDKMDQSITIRDATAKDVEVLASIIRQSFHDVAKRFSLTPENCPKHPSNCTTTWIESDQSRGVRYFILWKNGKPIGCVGLESPNPDLCYLERLSVIPEMRRKGNGRALALHALECAKATGAMQVSIGIIADHTELKKWYANIGFVEVGRKKFEHLPFEVVFLKFDLSR